MTILYILLFIVCLSTLIMVHEAGHLATAKIFKVYCFEYAIGFGPRLFSFKRKGGETRFSLRAIPFGGFVSMYGESDAIPEDVTEPIDPSRSINSIKKWKRAIIMTAGIMMNFLLAILIFFVYEVGFPKYTARVGHITVKKDSLAEIAGLHSKDYVYTPIQGYNIFYDDNAILTYGDDSTLPVYFGYDYGSITLKDQAFYNRAVAYQREELGSIASDYISITYDQAINGDYSSEEIINNYLTGYIRAFSIKQNKDKTYSILFGISENYLDEADKTFICSLSLDKETYENKFKYVPVGAYISVVGDISKEESHNEMTVKEYLTSYPETSKNYLKEKNGGLKPNKINFNVNVLDEETPSGKGVAKSLECVISDNGKLDKELGLYMQLDSHRNGFGESIGNTFVDFGESATLIYRALGQLFTGQGWNNIGGIIAIGVSTTQILEQNGFGLFLYYWAMISVNLGIVNLLPFPGLDGWHFLVAIVEGVSKKDIPPKVKNVVSAVGLIILFLLMIMVIIKDLIMVL